MRWVGESSSGRLAPAPALAGHVAFPDPAWAERWRLRLGGPGDTWRSRSHQGRSVPPAAGAEHPSSRDTWRHRTLPRAGGGSGAVGLVRWSPDNRGPAAQLLGAQLRITTRVLPFCSRSRYPCYRVPTVSEYDWTKYRKVTQLAVLFRPKLVLINKFTNETGNKIDILNRS